MKLKWLAVIELTICSNSFELGDTASETWESCDNFCPLPPLEDEKPEIAYHGKPMIKMMEK